MTVKFGPGTVLGVTDTSEIGFNDATNTYWQTVASSTIASGSGYTNVCTQSIGPYPWDVTVAVTATGEWEFETGANPDSALLSIGIQRFSPPYINNRVIYRTPAGTTQPASTTNQGGYSVSETFTLTAGTTALYMLAAIGTWGQPATSAYKILNTVFSAQVLKR